MNDKCESGNEQCQRKPVLVQYGPAEEVTDVVQCGSEDDAEADVSQGSVASPVLVPAPNFLQYNLADGHNC